MARIVLRIDFTAGRIGPGKIMLLEAIERSGSISAAGRALGMSYRRAWVLVEALNAMFADPVVTTQLGGTGGGGARLTELGRTIVASYRALEANTQHAADVHLAAIEAALADRPSPSPPSRRKP